jgi:hypothetical protein
MEQWSNGAMEQWSNGAMGQWSNGAIGNGAMGDRAIRDGCRSDERRWDTSDTGGAEVIKRGLTKTARGVSKRHSITVWLSLGGTIPLVGNVPVDMDNERTKSLHFAVIMRAWSQFAAAHRSRFDRFIRL